MTCAILIPSLNRPQRLLETIEAIRANTTEPYQMLFCVSDEESKRILDLELVFYLDDSDDEDHRYVTRMNKLAREAASRGFETMFFGSDDVIHQPGWLTQALKVLDAYAVVVVNDLHNPNGTQALMRTDYLPLAVFDAPGDAFHHGYLHNFADNEQHFTAWKRGEYARAMESHVEHLHPLFRAENSIAWDQTYTNAQQGWAHDEELYRQRSALIDVAVK